MKLTAINPKYQRDVERAYAAIRKYHEIVNANAEKGRDSSPAQERAYDKWLEIIGEIPAREAQQVRRYHLAMHGYEA